MIHYNKVNWKNFAKYFLKFFPIDFQYPIDFSQLHMIRPLVKNRLNDISGDRLAEKTSISWLLLKLHGGESSPN